MFSVDATSTQSLHNGAAHLEDSDGTVLPVTPHSIPLTISHTGEAQDNHNTDTYNVSVTLSERRENHIRGNANVISNTDTACGKETAKNVHPPLWRDENETDHSNILSSPILPPSPPLTRVSSLENSPQTRQPEPTEESVATSAEYTGASHAYEGMEHSATRPSIVVGPHWLSSDNALPGPSSEDGMASAGISHPLQAERAVPHTPPIWETVDPPPDHNSGRSHIQPETSSARNQNQCVCFAGYAEKRSFYRLSHRKGLVPKSSYYFGPPPVDSAYGTDPQGQIGVHHPREVLRVERDWSVGDIPQFTSSYPLELENRVRLKNRWIESVLLMDVIYQLSPTEYLETVNAINEILISAYDLRYSALDNAVAFFTLYLSRLVVRSHYEKVCPRVSSSLDLA